MAISPGGRPADASPIGPGNLWKTPGLKLPTYIRMIAHARMRAGASKAEAISEAVAAVKRMAAGVGPSGKGHVRPQVQAAAAAAVAEWVKARAQARGSK